MSWEILLSKIAWMLAGRCIVWSGPIINNHLATMLESIGVVGVLHKGGADRVLQDTD